MARPKTNKNSRSVVFKLEEEKYSELEKIAVKNHLTISDVMRASVDRTLSLKSFDEQEQKIYDNISEAVKNSMKIQVDRLASLIVKGAILEGRNYFTSTKVFALMAERLDFIGEQEFQEILSAAAKYGTKYMGIKEQNMDSFINSAVNDMNDNI